MKFRKVLESDLVLREKLAPVAEKYSASIVAWPVCPSGQHHCQARQMTSSCTGMLSPPPASALYEGLALLSTLKCILGKDFFSWLDTSIIFPWTFHFLGFFWGIDSLRLDFATGKFLGYTP